jgi:hypothetical protein
MYIHEVRKSNMNKRTITIALANADLETVVTSLSDDVVFHSPILATVADEVRGRDVVVKIVQAAIACYGLPKNVDEFQHEDGRYIVTFDGEIEGNLIQGGILITENAEGKVESLRFFMRPWPVVKLFREYMQRNLSPDPISDAIFALPSTA